MPELPRRRAVAGGELMLKLWSARLGRCPQGLAARQLVALRQLDTFFTLTVHP
jgi:hypothetical protein